MAISPKHLEEAFQAEVDSYEQHLDRILVNKKIRKGQSIDIINIPTGMNWQHFSLLRERYKSAGWTELEWNSNQREGEWITFKY